MSELVYILILNYNNFHQTKECIDTCLEQNYDNYQILVVDNNSQDDSVSRLHSEFGHKIHYLSLNENTGYARGNNIGLEYASKQGAKYTFLINNDTKLIGIGLLSELVDILNGNPLAMAVNPIIYNDNDGKLNKVDNYSNYVRLLRFFGLIKVKQTFSEARYDSTYQIHGSALLINNLIFQRLNGFPYYYFMYNEENHLSFLSILSGYILLEVKTSSCYIEHHHKGTKHKKWRTYLVSRNFELSKSIFANKKVRIWIIHMISNMMFYTKCFIYSKKEYIKPYKDGIVSARAFKHRPNMEELLYEDAKRSVTRYDNG